MVWIILACAWAVWSRKLLCAIHGCLGLMITWHACCSSTDHLVYVRKYAILQIRMWSKYHRFTWTQTAVTLLSTLWGLAYKCAHSHHIARCIISCALNVWQREVSLSNVQTEINASQHVCALWRCGSFGFKRLGDLFWDICCFLTRTFQFHIWRCWNGNELVLSFYF